MGIQRLIAPADHSAYWQVSVKICLKRSEAGRSLFASNNASRQNFSALIICAVQWVETYYSMACPLCRELKLSLLCFIVRIVTLIASVVSSWHFQRLFTSSHRRFEKNRYWLWGTDLWLCATCSGVCSRSSLPPVLCTANNAWQSWNSAQLYSELCGSEMGLKRAQTIKRMPSFTHSGCRCNSPFTHDFILLEYLVQLYFTDPTETELVL